MDHNAHLTAVLEGLLYVTLREEMAGLWKSFAQVLSIFQLHYTRTAMCWSLIALEADVKLL